MDDFYLTFPYGLFLMFGGSLGYFRKGSVMSLVGGGVCGLLILLAGKMSLSAYNKGTNSWPAHYLQTAVALALTLMMAKRYSMTGKVIPAGLVAGISAVMTLFYLYKLVTGGNHVPKTINVS